MPCLRTRRECSEWRGDRREGEGRSRLRLGQFPPNRLSSAQLLIGVVGTILSMSEQDAIERSEALPATVDSLTADLHDLGVLPGSVLLIHSSLSSLGWVCGGPIAVIAALKQAIGATGTLVMPTHSGDLSDPSKWGNPSVPEHWWPTIRATMPPYDASLTPTRAMGIIPECFRHQAGVLRSNHPQVSFAAYGPHANAIVEHQPP